MNANSTGADSDIKVGSVLRLIRMAITADGYRNSRERESTWTVKSVIYAPDGTPIVRFNESKNAYRLENGRLWSQHRAYEVQP